MEHYGNSGVFSVSNLYVYASVPAAQNYFNYLDFYRDHSVSGGKGISEGADVCLPTCKPAVCRALQWV